MNSHVKKEKIDLFSLLCMSVSNENHEPNKKGQE